jgi:DNA-binding NtrC family response regulator
MRYSWLGNSWQLENEVKRLVVSVRGRSITDSHFDQSIRATPSLAEPAPAAEPASRSLASAVHDLECRLIEEGLREHGGNKQKTAEALGLSRPGFFRKLKSLGIKS